MKGEHDHIAGRGMVALGGCSIMLIVTLAAGAGACLLFQRRGEAGSMISKDEKEISEIDAVRRDLLVLSGELSDPSRESHDLTRAARHLETLKIRLDTQSDEPGYLKVRALHESVELQVEILRNKEEKQEEEIPPLPAGPTVPPMDDRYVGIKVSKSLLIKSRIFSPSPSRTVRYGPALLHPARKPKKRKSISSLAAPKGWTFLEVEMGIKGKADLIEYSMLLLDDYRRGFPPYLAAEKYLMKQKLTGSTGEHAVWREVHSTTSTKKVLWLHRVFAVPRDSMKHPVLEVHRQGAAKRVWVQY